VCIIFSLRLDFCNVCVCSIDESNPIKHFVITYSFVLYQVVQGYTNNGNHSKNVIDLAFVSSPSLILSFHFHLRITMAQMLSDVASNRPSSSTNTHTHNCVLLHSISNYPVNFLNSLCPEESNVNQIWTGSAV